MKLSGLQKEVINLFIIHTGDQRDREIKIMWNMGGNPYLVDDNLAIAKRFSVVTMPILDELSNLEFIIVENIESQYNADVTKQISKGYTSVRLLPKIFKLESGITNKMPSSNHGINFSDITVNIAKFSKWLAKSFNVAEFKNLCLELNVDAEEFTGGKSVKFSEFVMYMDRRSEMTKLIKASIKKRPNNAAKFVENCIQAVDN